MDLLVNIDVDDLDRGIEFYERGIGLRLARRLFDGTVAELLGASSPIYLLAKKPGTRSGAQPAGPRNYGRHWTPVHLDFVVDDIDTALGRALEAGANLEGEVRSFPWGRLATVSDPFGHGLCLVQWMGAGYDEAR